MGAKTKPYYISSMHVADTEIIKTILFDLLYCYFMTDKSISQGVISLLKVG